MSDTAYRQAPWYDLVIGNAGYLRAVWSVSPADFDRFARVALADGQGSFLDVGCGTLVFTADAYRASGRSLTLTDLSEEMLSRARKRIAARDATLMQADLFDLPFEPGTFETVASFGVLHCIDDLDGALAAIAAQLAPGGRVFLSSLVTATRRSRAMARMLHRAGEFAEPRTEGQFEAAVAERFRPISFQRRGSMVYAIASAR